MNRFRCWRLFRGPYAIGYCAELRALVVVRNLGRLTSRVYENITPAAWQKLCSSLAPFDTLNRILGRRVPQAVHVQNVGDMDADRFALEFDGLGSVKMRARACG